MPLLNTAVMRPAARISALSAMACCVFAGPAHAHVKWFAAYDIAAPPEPLSSVFSVEFVGLLFLTAYLLFVVFIIDCLLEDYRVDRTIDRFLVRFKSVSADVMRGAAGVFLVCLWLVGGAILTPELKTSSAAVSWIQLLLALCTVSWRTTFIAGLGIVGLYFFAMAHYGVFHLLDYPLFLGIAAYLIIHSLRISPLLPYALSILYASAAQTLLWASVEKWAYWDWTMPLLERHPHITLGIDPKIYVMLAGFVEFALTFALLVGRTSQRVMTFGLLVIFVAAIIDFGKIDVVGHLMIIATLGVIIINGNTHITYVFHSRSNSYLREGAKLSSLFFVFLAAYVCQYYLLHALLY